MSFSHLSLPMPCLPLLFEQSLHNQIRSLPELGLGSSHMTAVENNCQIKEWNLKDFQNHYLMSHDEFHRIWISAKFAREIFSIAFFQVIVHRIFSKLAQHVSQIFSVVFRVINAINKTASEKLGVGIGVESHCSKSSFFVQKFNYDFLIVDFVWVKNSLIMLWFWTF